jgi:hypothetical protein
MFSVKDAGLPNCVLRYAGFIFLKNNCVMKESQKDFSFKCSNKVVFYNSIAQLPLSKSIKFTLFYQEQERKVFLHNSSNMSQLF